MVPHGAGPQTGHDHWEVRTGDRCPSRRVNHEARVGKNSPCPASRALLLVTSLSVLSSSWLISKPPPFSIRYRAVQCDKHDWPGELQQAEFEEDTGYERRYSQVTSLRPVRELEDSLRPRGAATRALLRWEAPNDIKSRRLAAIWWQVYESIVPFPPHRLYYWQRSSKVIVVGGPF